MKQSSFVKSAQEILDNLGHQLIQAQVIQSNYSRKLADHFSSELSDRRAAFHLSLGLRARLLGIWTKQYASYGFKIKSEEEKICWCFTHHTFQYFLLYISIVQRLHKHKSVEYL